MASKKPANKKGSAKKPKKRGSSAKKIWRSERLPLISGLSLIAISLFLLIAFISHLFTWTADQSTFGSLSRPWSHLFDRSVESANHLGRLGAIISHQFFYRWFGLSSFFILLFSFAAGFNLIFRKHLFQLGKIFRHLLFFLIWTPVALDFVFHRAAFPFGGGYGRAVNAWLNDFLGAAGTGILLFFVFFAYLVITFNLDLAKWGNAFVKKSKTKKAGKAGETSPDKNLPKDIRKREEMEYGKEEAIRVEIPESEEVQQAPAEELEITGIEMETEKADPDKESKEGRPEEEIELDISEREEEKVMSGKKLTAENYDPTLDLPRYKYPILDLLEDYGDNKLSIDKQELERNKDQIISTLSNYNISISRIKATVGPTVTLYEIVPAPGVRISKIKNLEDDIALSLAALGIRIIAPIPGKGTIGIEVPNRKKEIVSMRSMLASEKFIKSKYELPIALGKTIANEHFIADLAKMPHLLMAGATGQGKSVGLNAILVSLLYKKHPSQIKFVLIDPKKVELSLFKRIENHFLATLPDNEETIITDTSKVIATLNSLTKEMDMRYDLLKEGHVRNIKEYNEKFVARRLNPEKGHRFMPYIILIIDEFADLMMTAGKEVEQPIARLAQLARAVGIHLIVATQRPSVNIITGVIKANFPARVAFKVTSKVDSRTILDSSGADQLIGRGDMLLSVGGNLVRLQCAFIDTHEVEQVTDFIGEQKGYSDPYYLPEADDESTNFGGFDASDRDEMFEEAARLVVSTQQGSTSMIQRKMRLGYNRAGRIMDQLEAAGIVGPSEGSKAREVLIHTEYELEQFLKNL